MNKLLSFCLILFLSLLINTNVFSQGYTIDNLPAAPNAVNGSENFAGTQTGSGTTLHQAYKFTTPNLKTYFLQNVTGTVSTISALQGDAISVFPNGVWLNTAAGTYPLFYNGQIGACSHPDNINQITAGDGNCWILSPAFTNNAQSVATNAALAASPVANFPNGVWRISFYAFGVVPSSPAPPLFFNPQTGSCASNGLVADNGYCVNDPSNNSWVAEVGTEADPREWGAYHNAARFNAAVVIGASNATITVTGIGLTASNVGQKVVVYDFTDPPYTGTIAAGTTSLQLVVSPAPSFSYSGTAAIAYGTDDSVAINAAISYVNSVSTIHRPVNLGGFKYGVLNPISMLGGVDLENGYLQVLGQGTFIPDPYNSNVNGVIDVVKNNNNIFHIWVDAADLPVNCYDVESPGQIRIGPTDNCQHWGQNYSNQATTSFAMNMVDSTGQPNYTATVASTANLTTGMFYHQVLSGGPSTLPDNVGIVQVVDSTHLVLSSPPTANISSATVTFYKDGNCLMVGAQHSGSTISEDLNCQQFIVTDPNSGSTNPSIRGGAALYWGANAGASVVLASILQDGSVPIFQDSGGINLEVDGSFIVNGGNVSMTNSSCYMNAVVTSNNTLSMFNDTFTDCMFDYFTLSSNFIGMAITGSKYQQGTNAPHLPYNQIFNFVTNQSSSTLSSNFYNIQPPYFYTGTYTPIDIFAYGGGSWSTSAYMTVGAINNLPKGNNLFPLGRNTAPFTFTANTDGTTAILTNVGSFSGGAGWSSLALGMGISGTGVPNYSYITGFNQTAKVITINVATTAANVGTTMTGAQLQSALWYADSGCSYNYSNGATAINTPVPADLPAGWTCNIFVNGAGTFTLRALGAGTINGSGSTMVLSQNTPYILVENVQGNLSVK